MRSHQSTQGFCEPEAASPPPLPPTSLTQSSTPSPLASPSSLHSSFPKNMSPTKLQQHQNVADTLGAAVSKLRITVDDNLSAEEGIDSSEEAKSPTGASESLAQQLEDLRRFFRLVAAASSPKLHQPPKLVRQSSSASGQRLPRLARWRSEERQQANDLGTSSSAPRPQSTRARGISMLDGVVRKMRRSSSRSSPVLPSPTSSPRERTQSTPSSPFPASKVPNCSASSTPEGGTSPASVGASSHSTHSLPMPSPHTRSRFRFPARARTPPASKTSTLSTGAGKAGPKHTSAEDNTRTLEWWRARSGLVVELLTQSPDCVTSFLKCDQEFSLPQRKQVLQELFSLCLADVESDPRQQLLLANLAEDLLEAELQAHSGAENKESSVEGAAWLRSSSSAASLFLTTYLRRPECEAAVSALLDSALDPAQSKNGPSSDPAILAERILRKLRPDAVPAGMRLLCRQLAALAPPGLREPLLGGFIILKFINPSLVSVPRSTHAQRVLVDVARHLQHLANHAATPDAARAKTADLDAFLMANRGAILAVFSSFS